MIQYSWDITRYTEISQDLLIWQNTFDIWYSNFYLWHLASTEILQDQLRSHKINWDLKRSTDLALYIVHLTFDIDMPWHLTWLKVLTALAPILIILAHSYHIFTDGFWGYLQSKKIISHSLTHSLTHSVNNIGLRDASASKKWDICGLTLFCSNAFQRGGRSSGDWTKLQT